MGIEQRIGQDGKSEYALLINGIEVYASPSFEEIEEMYENELHPNWLMDEIWDKLHKGSQ